MQRGLSAIRENKDLRVMIEDLKKRVEDLEVEDKWTKKMIREVQAFVCEVDKNFADIRVFIKMPEGYTSLTAEETEHYHSTL